MYSKRPVTSVQSYKVPEALENATPIVVNVTGVAVGIVLEVEEAFLEVDVVVAEVLLTQMLLTQMILVVLTLQLTGRA